MINNLQKLLENQAQPLKLKNIEKYNNRIKYYKGRLNEHME